MKVELRSVTKRFPFPHDVAEEIVALDDVSMSIESGAYLVLSGPSGGGKSTLLSLAGGMAFPTTGQVLWDDEEIRPGKQLASVRGRRVGFAFQETPFLPELTARENLLLPGLLAPPATAARDIDAALARFGLQDRFDCYPAALSAGERRRLCVARALLGSCDLLILDEPTADLDDDWVERLMDEVEAAARDRGATLLVATHDARTHRRADRHLVLRAGSLK